MWNHRAIWLTVAAAAALSAAIGWRNYFVYQAAGRYIPLWECIVGEVPVWFGWAACVPAIVFLARRFPPLGAAAWRYGLLHLGAAGAASLAVTIASVAFRMLLPNTPSPANLNIGFIDFTRQVFTSVGFSFLFVYATIFGWALTVFYYADQRRREIREAQLQRHLAETRRDLLRAQIHPHFLFNTMHAISALMSVDVPGARQMMADLSELLRMALDEDARQEVSLAEELVFVERYLDIQQVRFRGRLSVEFRVEPGTRGLFVPRFLLQPLVENAVIHGFAPLERAVRVLITASVDGDDLVLTVEDDGAGLPATLKEGIGISNIRARLADLYQSAASLSLTPGSPAGAVATVLIPTHAEPVEPDRPEDEY